MIEKEKNSAFVPPLPINASKKEMSDTVFNRFCDIVYSKSGIHLGPGKKALVCARIAKRLRSLGYDDYGAYLDHVEKDSDGTEIVNLLDVISTNVTSFFREPKSFDVFRDYLRTWIQSGQRRFRFWSSACSSGEEPFTMAMVIRETLISENITHASADIKILATDISTTVLQNCVRGTFREDKAKGIPDYLLGKYFQKHSDEKGNYYSANHELKSVISPRMLNLSTVPFPMKGPMDAVFCRNVMIYFDNRVRRALLDEIYRLLKPGGLLFVGHAESLAGMMMKEFKNIQPSIYIK